MPLATGAVVVPPVVGASVEGVAAGVVVGSGQKYF